jgi:nucleotide-binding universal stress UspA family protein
MYRVVLGVDEESEHARAAAETVAALPGDASETRVTLLHSFVDNPSGASATQLASVRAAADVLDEAGVEYEIAETSGDPAEAIIDEADAIDADLVVVGGRKRSPAGKALFGSVTQTVILNAGRPVMVTGVTRDV